MWKKLLTVAEDKAFLLVLLIQSTLSETNVFNHIFWKWVQNVIFLPKTVFHADKPIVCFSLQPLSQGNTFRSHSCNGSRHLARECPPHTRVYSLPDKALLVTSAKGLVIMHETAHPVKSALPTNNPICVFQVQWAAIHGTQNFFT